MRARAYRERRVRLGGGTARPLAVEGGLRLVGRGRVAHEVDAALGGRRARQAGRAHALQAEPHLELAPEAARARPVHEHEHREAEEERERVRQQQARLAPLHRAAAVPRAEPRRRQRLRRLSELRPLRHAAVVIEDVLHLRVRAQVRLQRGQLLARRVGVVLVLPHVAHREVLGAVQAAARLLEGDWQRLVPREVARVRTQRLKRRQSRRPRVAQLARHQQAHLARPARLRQRLRLLRCLEVLLARGELPPRDAQRLRAPVDEAGHALRVHFEERAEEPRRRHVRPDQLEHARRARRGVADVGGGVRVGEEEGAHQLGRVLLLDGAL
eukprot:2709178-Prymnesium_polylepis.2